MLNNFNTNRTKRMISKIKKQFSSKDKKVLIKQIENSLNNGDYAICITSLITMLDGLTLQLLEPNSDKQHLSYKAINDMLDYMDGCPPNQYSYELYLKVEILNNFYLKLYKNINNIKVANIRSLSRHINTHGVRYLNKKIEVLRLLNTIYYCQKIIEETQLQNRFTRTKRDNKFLVVSNNKGC